MDRVPNQSVLSGEIEVRVLRTPTGKRLGPGVYDITAKELTASQSHNIMGVNEYRQLQKRAQNLSTSRTSRNGGSATARSVTETAGLKRPSGPHKKVVISIRKATPAPTALFEITTNTDLSVGQQDGRKSSGAQSSDLQISQEGCVGGSRCSSTVGESYELRLSQKKEQREREIGDTMKNIEKFKKIVQASRSMFHHKGEEDVPSASNEANTAGDTTADIQCYPSDATHVLDQAADT